MSILSIQYLRGIAALMVVVYHLRPQLERMGASLPGGDWLSAGVDLFFVISGFIMWWTTCDSRIGPGRFMLKRIHRIVPLYWAITTLYVVVLLVAPGAMQTGALDPVHALASYFFIPWQHPVLPAIFPLVTPGWTLNYEMFFYLVFALCLLIPAEGAARERGLRARVGALALALGALVLAGALLDPSAPAPRFYTGSIMLEFLFGVGVAVLVKQGRILPPGLALLAIALGFLAWVGSEYLPNNQDTRFLWWGVPATAIIYGAVSLERRRALPALGLPLLLGDASYSIYISHQLSLSAAGQAWRKLAGDAPLWLSSIGFALFGAAVAIAVGLLCYFFLERPLGRWTGRFLPGGGGARSEGGARNETGTGRFRESKPVDKPVESGSPLARRS